MMIKQKHINIKTLISQQYFQEEQSYENTALFDIGKGYLELLTKKIIYFQFRKDLNHIQYVSSNIDKLVIDEIDISNQIHLGMCIGKAFKQKKYQILDKIQPEIKDCIRSSLLKLEKSSGKNGFLNQNQVTRAQSTKSNISLVNNSKDSIKEQKFGQQISEIEIKSLKKMNLDDDQNDLFQLHKLIQSISSKYNNQSTIELTDKFLSKIQNGNTAFNFFIQNFGFNKPLQKYEPQENLWKMIMTFQFEHHWTDDKKIKKISSVTDKQKKKAAQRCSKQILSQILKQFPLMFKDFAAVVKKKGLRL